MIDALQRMAYDWTGRGLDDPEALSAFVRSCKGYTAAQVAAAAAALEPGTDGQPGWLPAPIALRLRLRSMFPPAGLSACPAGEGCGVGAEVAGDGWISFLDDEGRVAVRPCGDCEQGAQKARAVRR